MAIAELIQTARAVGVYDGGRLVIFDGDVSRDEIRLTLEWVESDGRWRAEMSDCSYCLRALSPAACGPEVAVANVMDDYFAAAAFGLGTPEYRADVVARREANLVAAIFG